MGMKLQICYICSRYVLTLYSLFRDITLVWYVRVCMLSTCRGYIRCLYSQTVLTIGCFPDWTGIQYFGISSLSPLPFPPCPSPPPPTSFPPSPLLLVMPNISEIKKPFAIKKPSSHVVFKIHAQAITFLISYQVFMWYHTCKGNFVMLVEKQCPNKRLI